MALREILYLSSCYYGECRKNTIATDLLFQRKKKGKDIYSISCRLYIGKLNIGVRRISSTRNGSRRLIFRQQPLVAVQSASIHARRFD